jgi:2,3-dihydroxybenzoate decarboxylase/5-carboxyvanillate decarboxylase
MATLANDRLAALIARHPKRFAGLASFAPQDPAAAAREMDRAVNQLGLSGFIVNSHTDNRYLDEPFFWPILEAAEALQRPIYIRPRAPADTMARRRSAVSAARPRRRRSRRRRGARIS